MGSNPEQYRMSFGSHLEELRTRLLRGLIAPLIIFIPATIFGETILGLMTQPVLEAQAACNLPQGLQVLSPTEPFFAYLKLSLVVSLVLSGPVLIYQMWQFIAPGLYKHERRFGRLLMPMSVVLTVAGIFFLYFVALPLTLRTLISFGQGLELVPGITQPVIVPPDETGHVDGEGGGDLTAATPPTGEALTGPLSEMVFRDSPPPDWQPGQFYFDSRLHRLLLMAEDGTILAIDAHAISGLSQQFQLKTYINLVLMLMLGFGVAFQLPLVILLLGWMGIVDVAGLGRSRKYALVGVFVAGAILTPPDVISQICLAVPLYLLYELSIILLRIVPLSHMVRDAPGEESP